VSGGLDLATSDDAALVISAMNGDTAAFAQLYDRFAPLVRAVCKENSGSLAEAQDLAQKVFIRAYQRLSQLKKPDSFGPWLVSIARNVCREFRRSQARDRHVLVGLDPEELAPEKRTPRNDRLDWLMAAMEKLEPDEKLALHVYYLQDEDIEQAMKVVGVSRSGFYRLLAKAREKIEKYVHENEKE